MFLCYRDAYVLFLMNLLLAFFSSFLSIEQVDQPAALHSPSDISIGWVLPFVILLAMIATGPLFYAQFWHKYYAHISVMLALVVISYYVFGIDNSIHVAETFFEYIQFISLLASLYFASSGIRILMRFSDTPLNNTLFLATGGILANVIGTTGASMLLIRPYLELNNRRLKNYHVVFFIFIVSNIGGALTPIGDPPLFLGFLKGIPFFWMIQHNLLAWLFTMGVILLVFYAIDSRYIIKIQNFKPCEPKVMDRILINGRKNFIWLAIVIAAVFLDPHVFDWVPSLHFHGEDVSFIREIIMISVAFLAYRTSDKDILKANSFSLYPIMEVAFVFIGIFGTMMPALELVSAFAGSKEGSQYFTPTSVYWGTGFLSAFLDNAPTYLNFLTASLAPHGCLINSSLDVIHYTKEIGPSYIQAISIAAVFFGAMTYIGNGPNFMVRSIAKDFGAPTPYFFKYISHFSVPILLPIFILVWVLFILL